MFVGMGPEILVLNRSSCCNCVIVDDRRDGTGNLGFGQVQKLQLRAIINARRDRTGNLGVGQVQKLQSRAIVNARRDGTRNLGVGQGQQLQLRTIVNARRDGTRNLGVGKTQLLQLRAISNASRDGTGDLGFKQLQRLQLCANNCQCMLSGMGPEIFVLYRFSVCNCRETIGKCDKDIVCSEGGRSLRDEHAVNNVS